MDGGFAGVWPIFGTAPPGLPYFQGAGDRRGMDYVVFKTPRMDDMRVNSA